MYADEFEFGRSVVNRVVSLKIVVVFELLLNAVPVLVLAIVLKFVYADKFEFGKPVVNRVVSLKVVSLKIVVVFELLLNNIEVAV
jgi:hypothetical protein